MESELTVSSLSQQNFFAEKDTKGMYTLRNQNFWKIDDGKLVTSQIETWQFENEKTFQDVEFHGFFSKYVVIISHFDN